MPRGWVCVYGVDPVWHQQWVEQLTNVCDGLYRRARFLEDSSGDPAQFAHARDLLDQALRKLNRIPWEPSSAEEIAVNTANATAEPGFAYLDRELVDQLERYSAMREYVND